MCNPKMYLSELIYWLQMHIEALEGVAEFKEQYEIVVKRKAEIEKLLGTL